MIAGNIPGRTQTLPLAIYDAVQNRQYVQANRMVLIMTVFSLVSLWLVRRVESSYGRTTKKSRTQIWKGSGE